MPGFIPGIFLVWKEGSLRIGTCPYESSIIVPVHPWAYLYFSQSSTRSAAPDTAGTKWYTQRLRKQRRHSVCPVAKCKRGAEAKNPEAGSLQLWTHNLKLNTTARSPAAEPWGDEIFLYHNFRDVPDDRDKFAEVQHDGRFLPDLFAPRLSGNLSSLDLPKTCLSKLPHRRMRKLRRHSERKRRIPKLAVFNLALKITDEMVCREKEQKQPATNNLFHNSCCLNITLDISYNYQILTLIPVNGRDF